MATWRELIDHAAEDDKIIACTLSDDEMQIVFDDGYGVNKGVPFTAWSENFVYFPVVYDGAEWVGRTPRNPCDVVTRHQGGQ